MNDFELEYKIKVHKETKNSSLYKWCIKETEKNGKIVENSRDQIPWIWRNNFSTKSINYYPSWKLENSENISTNKGKSKSKNISNFVEEEIIIGTLVPEQDRTDDLFQPDATKYSMFGTNRLIEDFRFRIEIDEEEKCSLWGCPQYTDNIDHRRYLSKDMIEIYIGLSEKKFRKIVEIISNQSFVSLSLSLRFVRGFYSDWSPSIFTDHVKVLTLDHNLEIPKECDSLLQTLGECSEIQIISNISKELITHSTVEDTEDETIDEYEEDSPKLSNYEILQKQIVDELTKLRENSDKQQIYIQRYMWLILISIIVIIVILL